MGCTSIPVIFIMHVTIGYYFCILELRYFKIEVTEFIILCFQKPCCHFPTKRLPTVADPILINNVSIDYTDIKYMVLWSVLLDSLSLALPDNTSTKLCLLLRTLAYS